MHIPQIATFPRAVYSKKLNHNASLASPTRFSANFRTDERVAGLGFLILLAAGLAMTPLMMIFGEKPQKETTKAKVTFQQQKDPNQGSSTLKSGDRTK